MSLFIYYMSRPSSWALWRININTTKSFPFGIKHVFNNHKGHIYWLPLFSLLVVNLRSIVTLHNYFKCLRDCGSKLTLPLLESWIIKHQSSLGEAWPQEKYRYFIQNIRNKASAGSERQYYEHTELSEEAEGIEETPNPNWALRMEGGKQIAYQRTTMRFLDHELRDRKWCHRGAQRQHWREQHSTQG